MCVGGGGGLNIILYNFIACTDNNLMVVNFKNIYFLFD